MSENSIVLMLTRLRSRLAADGITVRIHAHLFRHNFLTEKALDGENPSMVRRWAGHKSYEMTDYYFGLAESKLAAIQPKRSTLAGLVLPGTRRQRTVGRSAASQSTILAPSISKSAHRRPVGLEEIKR